jgi:MFS family permease
MAAFSALSGIAATVGPILGPALLDWNLAGQSWRLVFWVNVPVGAFAAIAAARLLPDERGSGTGRPDLPSVLVASAGLTLVVYPLIAVAAGSGWPTWAYPVIVAGLVVLAVFCILQRHTASHGGQPLIDIALFARRSLAGGLAVQLLFLVPIMGFFLTVMQFLQRGLGMSPPAPQSALMWTCGPGARLRYLSWPAADTCRCWLMMLAHCQSTASLTGSAGPTGDVATRRDRQASHYRGKPHPRHEDHDLQLEYWDVGGSLSVKGRTPFGCLRLLGTLGRQCEEATARIGALGDHLAVT